MRAKLPAVLFALVVALSACGGDSDGPTTANSVPTPDERAAGGSKIVIGSFGFAESEVLAQIYGAALTNGGANVTYRLKLGSREVVAPALEKGDIDLVPEYLGNYLGFLDKAQTKGLTEPDALKALETAAKAKGITVADASKATDSDVIAVTKDFATKNGLKTISDLGKLPGPITLAGPSECEIRQTCLLGLRSAYGLDITFTSTGADAGGPITKKALTDGTAQIGRLFSSDPDTQKAGKFVILKDDRSFQQPGNIVPVLRTSKATPAILEVLNKVSKALTTEKLADLNEKMDKDKEDPAAVAAAFVSTENL